MKRINIALGSLMLLGLLFSCSKASLNYTQNGNWVTRAPLTIGFGYGVGFTVDSFAYVGTGVNPVTPNTRLKIMWRYSATTINNSIPTGYDSAKGSWTQVADFPGVGRSHAVAFTITNQHKGYVGTGTPDGYSVLADFYAYDPSSNSWSTIDSLGGSDQNGNYATAPREEAAAMGFDTTAIVLTGYDYQYYYNDVWQYSPTTNLWTKRALLPGNARKGASTWVYNGLGYLVCGQNGGSSLATNGYCYDFYRFDPTQPDETAWTQLRNIANTSSSTYDDGYTNIVRANAAAFVLKGTLSGDKGYITTGGAGTSYTYTWEYDFATDLWTEKTPFEGTARVGAVGLTVKNRGFVGFGVSGASATSGNTDLLEFFPNQIYNQND